MAGDNFMNDIRVYEEFQIELDRESVLRLMDCYPDSPVYEEAIEEYEELKPMMLDAVRPRGIICFGMVPVGYEVEDVIGVGDQVIYSIVTIGDAASSMSSRFFEEGDYLKGMLADVMADSCVFAMEKDLRKYIKEVCDEKEIGISHRYEAPVDIPMTYQLLAYEQASAKENLDMNITSGYMLDPLKSNCQVYTISKDKKEFKVEHDCRNCNNLTCKLRNIPDTDIYIYDKQGNYKKKIRCKYTENLLEAYTRQEGYMSAPCGGHGTCGKCKIRVRKGVLPITESDASFFGKEELEQGYRLSCKAYPTVDCEIEMQQDGEDDFVILGAEETVNRDIIIEGMGDQSNVKKDVECSLAIDIGTTTLAISLVEVESKKILDTYTAINHQRNYGADVISRIQASNEGKGTELKDVIQKDLLKGIKQLLQIYEVKPSCLKDIIIAGNTTMTHLLLGFSCGGLGVVPFTPVDISMMEKSFQEVFLLKEGVETAGNQDEDWMNAFASTNVVFLPGISTYVGGDIVAGIFASKMQKSERYNILVDLGTNGEMAIGNQERILVTSTAMGPACEGGNITHGMGGVSGAISSVTIDLNQKVVVQTIGNQPPIGICGTGVLETVAELVKCELVDETGLLDEDYFEEGFPLTQTLNGEIIVFTQKDVREVQLAKSAVRAGVETLMKRAGVTYDQVGKLYLAGGFGFHMDKEKAVAIGMFPEQLLDKIEIAGNTALAGAIGYTHEERGEFLKIVDISEEISLSVDKYFNELYVEHMFFEC